MVTIINKKNGQRMDYSGNNHVQCLIDSHIVELYGNDYLSTLCDSVLRTERSRASRMVEFTSAGVKLGDFFTEFDK